jgi:hypothetical protein
MRKVIAVWIVIAAMTIAGARAAEAKGPQPEGGPPLSDEKAQALTLAQLLVSRGTAAKDPLALVEAAKVMHDNGVSLSLDQDKSKPPQALTIDKLLTDAAAMAHGKPDVLKVVQQEQAAIGGDSKAQKKWVCYWWCNAWGYCWYACY